MERRRTLTMNWDRLGDDNDHSFESLGDSGSDDDDRMSFSSAVSSSPFEEMQSFKSSPAPFEGMRSFKSPTPHTSMYDMWMSEPGSIQDRRKRLFQGMGLNSSKDLLSVSSTKFDRGVSEEVEIQGKAKNDNVKGQESKEKPGTEIAAEAIHEPSKTTAIVHIRSRSDGELVLLSSDTERRKERFTGDVSKQRITRTLSVYMTQNAGDFSGAFQPKAGNLGKSSINRSALDDQLGSYLLIKNLDNGTEFLVNQNSDKGSWNKLSDLQTGKQLTIEEFEKSVGYSPVVKELMHRTNETNETSNPDDEAKVETDSVFSKRFRNSRRKGAALLRNIKGKANNMGGKGDKESNKNSSSQWVKVRQQGKQFKEFTGLHLCQEIQAHEGSIWTIKFSSDARYLASAGEDKFIHVWEVQECDVDMNSVGEPEKRTKGKNSRKKEGNSIPDYVDVPETVFALSEQPVCSFTGHQDDILDLSWSKSQLLLSSSMDKTVRLWDMKTQDCLKMFAHNDYVTCIQFNPKDDNYFLSGSLDAKIRIWNIPDRQVVDWMDVREMVTAVCYSPDGQDAVVGSHKGSCRMYSTAEFKLEQKQNIYIQTKKKAQLKKITGFQYNPSNPSEMLITSADSRIRIYDGSEITNKFIGFRNTSSQIASSFSPDGKYVISASEDSQVYVWKRAGSRHAGHWKHRTIIDITSREQFPCRDVSVAIPWPGSSKNEVPVVEIHSKRHSKRINPHFQSGTDSPTKEKAGTNSKGVPPVPRMSSQSERVISSPEKDPDHISRTESGKSEFSSASTSSRYDPSSISNSRRGAGSQSWSSSRSWFDVGHCHGHTIEATAWGLVIVTASLGGEIRAYQNFGLPLKVSRHPYLFRDLT